MVNNTTKLTKLPAEGTFKMHVVRSKIVIRGRHGEGSSLGGPLVGILGGGGGCRLGGGRVAGRSQGGSQNVLDMKGDGRWCPQRSSHHHHFLPWRRGGIRGYMGFFRSLDMGSLEMGLDLMDDLL